MLLRRNGLSAASLLSLGQLPGVQHKVRNYVRRGDVDGDGLCDGDGLGDGLGDDEMRMSMLMPVPMGDGDGDADGGDNDSGDRIATGTAFVTAIMVAMS